MAAALVGVVCSVGVPKMGQKCSVTTPALEQPRAGEPRPGRAGWRPCTRAAPPQTQQPNSRLSWRRYRLGAVPHHGGHARGAGGVQGVPAGLGLKVGRSAHLGRAAPVPGLGVRRPWREARNTAACPWPSRAPQRGRHSGRHGEGPHWSDRVRCALASQQCRCRA